MACSLTKVWYNSDYGNDKHKYVVACSLTKVWYNENEYEKFRWELWLALWQRFGTIYYIIAELHPCCGLLSDKGLVQLVPVWILLTIELWLALWQRFGTIVWAIDNALPPLWLALWQRFGTISARCCNYCKPLWLALWQRFGTMLSALLEPVNVLWLALWQRFGTMPNMVKSRCTSCGLLSDKGLVQWVI